MNEINNLFPEEIRAEVGNRLDLNRSFSDQEIMDVIVEVVLEKSRLSYTDVATKEKIISTVFNSMRRLDILQPLLDNDSITEIMVNSADEIFIERNGRIEKTDVKFESNERLESIIQVIVAKVNRVVNEASPIVDARLADGSRVNIVMPPIALKGPTITIRKFPKKPWSMSELISVGAITKEASAFLEMIVKAKYNVFISGGTGSGKTTFLNVLSNFIPSEERVITIEDSAELQLNSIKNIVRMETRNPNTEGKGQITIRELIRASLRMRPDRIIVGEVRGPEAMDMLQAMNTGHDGSLSTGHANSTIDMFNRLETMVLSSANLPVMVARQYIASAIDIIVHLGRFRDGSRKVMEISEVVGVENGSIHLNPLFIFKNVTEGDCSPSYLLCATGNQLQKTKKVKLAECTIEGDSIEP